MSVDSAFLNDAFNNYFRRGVDAQNNGNISLAKQQYILAAETLAKLASQSSGSVKQAREERVRKIITLIDALETEPQPVPSGSSSSGSSSPDTKKGSGGKAKREGSETDWSPVAIRGNGFSDVVGLDDVKVSAKALIIDRIKHRDLSETYGVEVGGGILMYGLPGTGKTTVAYAIAREADAALFHVRCSDIDSKWVGESARNVRNLFEEARSHKVSIIFLDDCEALCKTRDADNDPTSAKVVTELLGQIDIVLGEKGNVLILAATNLPWKLDTALTSRFTRKIYIPLPDLKAREYLIRKGLKKAPLSPDVNLTEFAAALENYGGRDIMNLCNEIVLQPYMRAVQKAEAGIKAEEVITSSDIVNAMRKIRSSISNDDKRKLAQFMSQTE